MSYEIEFKSEAVIEIKTLTTIVQERILRKVRWLSENFDEITPQALSADLSGLFKIRVGDYRVIYSFDKSAQMITIHKVGHRRNIYS